MLTEKQQLELQQAADAGAKQQESIANLEKLMFQLKVDHEQLINQHTLETESSLKEAEEAQNTAVKVLFLHVISPPLLPVIEGRFVKHLTLLHCTGDTLFMYMHST